MTEPELDMYLPIEQAVYVPSTHNNKPISKKKFYQRVNNVRQYLSKRFGGYTSVSGVGGYYSNKEKKVIREKVVKVTSFGEKSKYSKYKKPLLKKIATWQKEWKQESVGYEKEGDLMYIKTRQKPKKRIIKRRVGGTPIRVKAFVFNPPAFKRR